MTNRIRYGDDRLGQLLAVQKEAAELFEKKNADYGDAFADYGPVGVIVRAGDKIRRLQHITNNGVTLISSESLRDTLVDLHNYAAMAVMLLDEGGNVKAATLSTDPASTCEKPENPCVETISELLFNTDEPAKLISSIFYPDIEPSTCQTVIDDVVSNQCSDPIIIAEELVLRLDAINSAHASR